MKTLKRGFFVTRLPTLNAEKLEKLLIQHFMI